MFNPRKVHEFAKTRDPDGNDVYQLLRVNPHYSISANGGPEVFLADGKAYSADRRVIPEDEWPSWLRGEIEKMSPAARVKAGFPREGDLVRSEDPLVDKLKRELAEAKRQLLEPAPDRSVEPSKPSEEKVSDGAAW